MPVGCECACAQSCLTLCDSMDCSPPASKGSSPPQDWTHVSFISCIGRWVLYHWATWEALDDASGWSQLIVTLETSMGLKILCSKLDRWLWHLHGQYCSLLLFKNNYEDFFFLMSSYNSQDCMTELCFWVHVFFWGFVPTFSQRFISMFVRSGKIL